MKKNENPFNKIFFLAMDSISIINDANYYITIL